MASRKAPSPQTRRSGKLPLGKRPGVAKTQGLDLIESRALTLFRSTDYRWRELFEAADVVSEGATRQEPDGSTYYGSTSILLLLRSEGGRIEDSQISTVTRILEHDPHARIRAIRIACLEAQVRAGGPIGRVRAELLVRADKRGVRIDVDVESLVQAAERSAEGDHQTSSPRRKRRGRPAS